MTKSVKSIIALGSALVVLGAGAVCWKMFMPDESSESSSSESSQAYGEGTQIIHNNPDEINKIEISNSSGDFNVVRLKKAEGEEKTLYTIQGYEDLLLDTSKLWTLSNNTMDVKANSIVAENCTDTEKYGFSNPVTAVLHYDSGNSVKFYIGDISPVAENTYFMIDGDDTLWIITAFLKMTLYQKLFLKNLMKKITPL